MQATRFPKSLIAVCTIVISLGAISSCNDTTSPQGTTPPPIGSSGDYFTMSVEGGPTVTYTETSGLPGIDCDPRVDWASSQIVGWSDFTNGEGPNGYDHFIGIMFPLADTVGTYTVQDDLVQVLVYNLEYYTASPAFPASTGTVFVTRADTRIEGTYYVEAADSTGLGFVTISGEFGVSRGISLSCQ